MAKKIARTIDEDEDVLDKLPSSTLSAPVANLFGTSVDMPRVTEVNVADIDNNPMQARKVFDEAALQGLADSIEQQGLQQPIVVRRLESDRFELIAGERRLRAHRLLGRQTIYAIVTKRDNPQVLSLVENVQRADLNAVELADGLQALVGQMGCTHREAGQFVGLTESVVSRTIRILNLPDDIRTEYLAAPDHVSRSTLMELADVKDEAAMRKLWALAKSGGLKRDAVRGVVKAAKEPTDGFVLKKVGSSIGSIRKSVAALTENKAALVTEHRQELQALHDELGRLLAVL